MMKRLQAMTGFDGAALRWSAVLTVIILLSPVPLVLPSGIALAVIGFVGAAVALFQSQQQQSTRPVPLSPLAAPARLT